MAAKKESAKKSGSTVTRIKASDSDVKKSASPKAKKVVKKPEVVAATAEGKPRRNPAKAAGGYFAGAWYELKQVRWPNRRATWSLTGAVILFTAFFVLLILILDALFKYLFELILG